MSADRILLPIGDEGDLTHAVLCAGRMAQDTGFDLVGRSAIMTALSELARNILKYAGRGEVVIARITGDRGAGVEIIARDRGPGIADVERALQDHFSTSGTLGLGLPGVRRLMAEFEIVSSPGQGTCVTARKWL
jgi:serine/threonine-protein kinase RsbT